MHRDIRGERIWEDAEHKLPHSPFDGAQPEGFRQWSGADNIGGGASAGGKRARSCCFCCFHAGFYGFQCSSETVSHVAAFPSAYSGLLSTFSWSRCRSGLFRLQWRILVSVRRAQWKYCLKVERAEAQPKVARETGCFRIVHDIPLIFFSSEPRRFNVSRSSLSQVHNRAFLSRVPLTLIISQRLRNSLQLYAQSSHLCAQCLLIIQSATVLLDALFYHLLSSHLNSCRCWCAKKRQVSIVYCS